MKKLLFVASVALAGIVLAAGPEGARRGPGMMRPGMMGDAPDPIVRMVTNPRLAAKLGLTEEQKEKFRAGERAQRETLQGLREKMRAANDKQASLMAAATIDEAAVMAAIDEVFEVRKAMAKAQTKRVIEVRSILTAEQIQMAADELQAMRTRRTRPMRPDADKPSAPAAAPAAPTDAPAAPAAK